MSDWVTCEASWDTWWEYGLTEAGFAGNQSCGASYYNGGMSFAELLTAGNNAYLNGQNLGHIFGDTSGYNGGLPCGYEVEIRMPGHWRTHVIRKSDIGSGRPGYAYRKIDLHPEIAYRLGWTPNQQVQVRPAHGTAPGSPPTVGPAPPPADLDPGPYDWSTLCADAWQAWAWYGGHALSNADFVEKLLLGTTYCDEGGPR